MIQFTVGGKAIAKQRARVVRRGRRVHAFTVKATVLWENWIKSEAVKHAPEKLLDGALGMSLNFYLPRPKSLSKKIIYPIKRPDLDNYEKSVMDALQDIIYTDDARIVVKHSFKQFGDPPRVDIKIWEI